MQKVLLVAGGALLGAAAGLYAGYELAKKRLYDQFNERMEDEITGMREFYEKRVKVYKTPEEAVKELVPETVVEEEPAVAVLEQVLGGLKYQLKDRPSPTAVLNVFAPQAGMVDDEEDGDWDKQVSERTSEKAYIITEEEFLKSNTDYNQVTLTWYAGDRVLADEDDEVIIRVERTVGVDNMKRFGYKSNDPNVVYVRNDKYHREYQVLLHSAKYKVHVQGLEDEDDPEAG